METALVLVSFYSDHSGFTVHRIYFQKDHDRAEKDVKMINSTNPDQIWELRKVEVYS